MYTFQWVRGLSTTWTAKNPVLNSGEPGLETDTRKFKIGDGVNRWNDLTYYLDENGISQLVDEAILELGAMDARVGDLTTLTTNEKTTIVGAVNEVNTPPVPLLTLYENAKAG